VKPGIAWLPFGALVLGAAFWGGTWPVARGVYTEVPPVTLAFLRCSIAAVTLALFFLPATVRAWPAIRAEGLKILVFAFTGLAAFTALIFAGLHHTTAVNGALINAATPIYIILLSLVGFGAKAKWKEAAGAAVAFCGLVIVVTRGEPQRLLELDINPGDLMVLLAMFFWAVYNILLNRWPSKVPPFVFLFACVTCASAMLLPGAVIEYFAGERIIVSGRSIGSMLYLGIGASVGAYASWNYGVRRVGAAPASIFQYLIPVFAAAFALLLLAEPLHLYHFGGAGLIVAGIVIANAKRRKPQPAAEQEPS
jgi:drug/metabolite transporter (DMT)-like permease